MFPDWVQFKNTVRSRTSGMWGWAVCGDIKTMNLKQNSPDFILPILENNNILT